jgi:cytochrome c553
MALAVTRVLRVSTLTMLHSSSKCSDSVTKTKAGRTNGGDSMIMRTIAFGLSDLEIKAVASYVSGLQ